MTAPCVRCGRPAEAHAGVGRGVTPNLAVRVRKARHPGRCALDGCPVRVGDRIGLLPGTGWAAVACITARQRDGQDQSERPAETGRHSQQEG